MRAEDVALGNNFKKVLYGSQLCWQSSSTMAVTGHVMVIVVNGDNICRDVCLVLSISWTAIQRSEWIPSSGSTVHRQRLSLLNTQYMYRLYLITSVHCCETRAAIPIEVHECTTTWYKTILFGILMNLQADKYMYYYTLYHKQGIEYPKWQQT